MSWYGDIWNGLTGIPSDAGITQKPPTDLSKGPDAQRLRDTAGLFNDQYNNLSDVPTAVPDATNSTSDRARIMAAMDYMRGIASGATTSPAELLARQGVTQNQGAQMGMAAALQGPYAGAAQRSGMFGAAMVPISSASSLAALHADEIARARQQLLDAAGALHGQDTDRENYLARLNQQQDEINNEYRLGLGKLTRSALSAPYMADKAAAQLGDQAKAANSTMVGGFLSDAAKAYAASRSKDDDETSFDNTGNMPPSGG